MVHMGRLVQSSGAAELPLALTVAAPLSRLPLWQVCVHFACKLLEGGGNVLLSEFDASWRLAVPDGMQPSLDMLKGEALIQGACARHDACLQKPAKGCVGVGTVQQQCCSYVQPEP